MRTVRLLALGSALLLGIPASGAAQESGKAGLTFGYPTAIGGLWHVSTSVAIRPGFVYTHSSQDAPTTGDSWGVGFDLGALFYVKKYDAVRTYFVPRFTYSHSSSTTTPTTGTTTLPAITSTGDTTGGAGLFGAQFFATPHFSVFGEVGIGFSHRTSHIPSSSLGDSKGSSWGTTAGIGVVFYP